MTAVLDVASLCHWRRGDAPDLTHQAFHSGPVCPFDTVAAVLAGRPDPWDLMAEWRIDISAALDARGKVPLSLNSRHHWAAHASRVAQIKAVTRNALLEAQVPHLDHVHVTMHYRPKTNRVRDIDNTVATQKPAVDAMHQPDSSENAPVPFVPIIDGDDPRYITCSWPVLHPWVKGQPAALWLILRAAPEVAS